MNMGYERAPTLIEILSQAFKEWSDSY